MSNKKIQILFKADLVQEVVVSESAAEEILSTEVIPERILNELKKCVMESIEWESVIINK